MTSSDYSAVMNGAAQTAAASSVSAIVEYIFERYPHTARQAGRHDFDGRLPQSCVRSPADLGLLAAKAAHHLEGLPDDADPELRADLDTALHMVEGERFRATDLGQAQLSPLEALVEAELSHYLRPYAPLAERLDALDVHLSRLPSFLADAAGALPDRQPAGERLLGVEYAQAQAISIGNFVRELAQDGGPGGPAGDGGAAERRAAAARAASAACADFGRAVAATKPTPGLLGPDKLAEFLWITEGIDRDPADLLEEAQAEVASLLAALDSAARDLGAAGWRDAGELLAGEVSDMPATEYLTIVIERLRDFWEQQDIVSMDTVRSLAVRSSAGLGTATTVDFTVSPPFEQAGQPHVLSIPPATAGSGEARF